MASKKRVVKQSILIVGEGAHDKAFLQHMKNLYLEREGGKTVKIDAATGGSPIEVIDDAIRKFSHAAYDKRVVLLDNDVKIPQQHRDKARKQKIEIIESTPVSLEGMLLDMLGIPVDNLWSSADCKAALHPRLSGMPTEPSSYKDLFTIAVLDASPKEQIIKLRALFSRVQGDK